MGGGRYERMYRFELAFCGEPQGVGLLQGLQDAVPNRQKRDRLYAMFDELPVPELDWDDPVEFWFREAGVRKFESAINTIIDTLADIDWQVLGCVMDDDSVQNAIYFDEYQAAFDRAYLETDTRRFRVVGSMECLNKI